MFQLFSRISWLIAIIAGIAILAIDNDLFIFAVGAVIVIRFFILSDNFIKERVRFFADQISTRNPQERSMAIEENEDKTGESEDEEPFPFPEAPISEVSPQIYEREDQETDEATEASYVTKSNTANTDSLLYKYNPADVISRFFSENILAKLGGILLFLGVLFFLALIGPAIFNLIGPVGKIVIGFMIGFGLFGVGVWLDGRGLEKEARIVMGTAILINYLVILSGRYLLSGDTSNGGLFSVGITFIFLILNTIFAVVTSLVYKSHTLLIFSFIFAYINPFLTGGSSTEPYTLLGYTMIVTFGALFMSYTRKDIILFILSFLFAAFLILVAPYSSSGYGWIAKLLCMDILGILALYVSTIFSKQYTYISEYLIGGSFFLIGILGILGIDGSLSVVQLLLLSASSLSLMSFAYFFSKKESYLYSLSTLATVLILSPAILSNGVETHTLIAVITIVLFGIINIGAIFTRENLREVKNLPNLTTGLIVGVLFLSGMIYSFGKVYFPGISLGFAYFGLAIVYSLLAFIITQKIGLEKMKQNTELQDIFYALAAIGVSLFSLAVAFVFSKSPEVISIIWLLEANILFFIFSKTQAYKVLLGAIVLFIIGVIRIIPFLDTSVRGEYGFIITILLLLISFIYNVKLLYSPQIQKIARIEMYVFHNIFHIIGMGVIAILLHEIILSQSSQWTSLWYFGSIASGALIFYSVLKALPLKVCSMVLYAALGIIHLGLFQENIQRNIENTDLLMGTLIALVFILPYFYEKITHKSLDIGNLFSGYLIYLLILSTQYVYYFFPTTFVITLYWGVLSSLLLGYGISQDIIKLRTIGLYLLSITAGKIFFYDIWTGFDGAISRVVALMVVGILMIAISTMYTRKYGNNLNSEFNPSNLFSQKEKNQDTKTPQKDIQSSIESIDISGIIGVRMYIDGEKTIQIRAMNLMKIAKMITQEYGKMSFAPSELQAAYQTISQDYKSSLSPAQYKKIKDIVKLFVDKGGKIEFIYE